MCDLYDRMLGGRSQFPDRRTSSDDCNVELKIDCGTLLLIIVIAAAAFLLGKLL